MSKPFKVDVNQSFEFEIDKSDIDNLDIINITKNQFHLLQNNASYKVNIITSDYDNKHYKVLIDGNTYDVSINSKLDQLIKVMGFEVGASKRVNDIKAPMPGLILDIAVSVGQEVKENDSLLILEAMKMENNIVSPRDGVIKSIEVSKGNAVEKNQLLIEFE